MPTRVVFALEIDWAQSLINSDPRYVHAAPAQKFCRSVCMMLSLHMSVLLYNDVMHFEPLSSVLLSCHSCAETVNHC